MPCQGRPSIFKSALVLWNTYTLISWGATRHALALNLGSPAIYVGLLHPGPDLDCAIGYKHAF